MAGGGCKRLAGSIAVPAPASGDQALPSDAPGIIAPLGDCPPPARLTRDEHAGSAEAVLIQNALLLQLLGEGGVLLQQGLLDAASRGGEGRHGGLDVGQDVGKKACEGGEQRARGVSAEAIPPGR